MGRARRARKIAATAAYGGGGLAATAGALGALGYGLIKAEAKVARRVVGQPFEGAPDDDGIYGAGTGTMIDLEHRVAERGDDLDRRRDARGGRGGGGPWWRSVRNGSIR